MHKLGLREPIIEERDNSVLVTLKHEKLASPEEAILDYLQEHPWINNSRARAITHIAEDHKIRAIFRKMESRNLIERTADSVTSNTRYQIKRRS